MPGPWRRAGRSQHEGAAGDAPLSPWRRQAAAALLLALLALAAAPSPAHAAAAAAASASAASFAATARTVDVGGQLTVTGYRLQGDAAESTLQLQRREIWAPGAPPGWAFYRCSSGLACCTLQQQRGCACACPAPWTVSALPA